ncbi:protein PIN-LIKES 7 [Morus notabilis]|uniref:protein PIN-LIKES 7 n=1 Tax=Morus notabilis TaxID=981085 RepID=UPI000CED556A|nr:protein PIN-LIKES 7 [Morus notabilis]
MGFFTLLEVASMPILQVLIVGMLGAFMATSYWNLLPADSRKSLNKIVFAVFTPSLVFASLAKAVTLEDIISWWFMPVNVGFTFLFGGILGWILVKILRPKPHLEGLIIATCSSGNLGNLLLIIVPAICKEDGSPFGDSQVCSTTGLSYVSFSMALGGFFIWTYTYQLIRTSSTKHKAVEAIEGVPKTPNKDSDADHQTHLLKPQDQDHLEDIIVAPADYIGVATKNQAVIVAEEPKSTSFWKRLEEILGPIKEELLAPPTLCTILGFIFGAVEWLRNLIIGDTAPLRVIQDSVQLLGDGTIPCITLILGGNLTRGLRSSKIKPLVIIGVVCIRYIILPIIGVWIVKVANHLGFLPPDPLFSYVLMVQFTLPPAMNIGTMTQLFDVAQEECSVLFLWTYLVAALALTFWSTIYMWNLS